MENVFANTMFFTYLSVSISSRVKLPTIETIFVSFFDLLSTSSRWVQGSRLVCFALFFTHDHESVKCKSVSREMYTFLEVKLRRLRRKTCEVNGIRDKNPTACKQF